MKNINKWLNFILPLLSVSCVIIVWAAAAKSINSEYILPTVDKTVAQIISLFKSAYFYRAFSSTFLRSVFAFCVSFGIAFVLAVLSAKIELVRKFVAPLISIMRALPTIAVVLLLLFWTNSKVAPIIVTMLVVMPTSYTHVINAFHSLDESVAEAGRVDGADETQVFLRIELPQTSYLIVNAIGSGISLNFKLMVAAEVLSQTANSIGYMLNTSKVYFEIAQMLAIVLVAVTVCVIIESVFNCFSRKLGWWKN